MADESFSLVLSKESLKLKQGNLELSLSGTQGRSRGAHAIVLAPGPCPWSLLLNVPARREVCTVLHEDFI